MNIKTLKDKIFNLNNLSIDETIFIFNCIMSGEISEIEIAGILVALKLKKESKRRDYWCYQMHA